MISLGRYVARTLTRTPRLTVIVLMAAAGCLHDRSATVAPPTLATRSFESESAITQSDAYQPRPIFDGEDLESVDQQELSEQNFRQLGLELGVTPRPWNFIVLHHSGTFEGSVESIDAEHRRRTDKEGRPWMGIGYHFVIGNGHGMPDGQIQPTFRWHEQLQGAHAGDAAHNQGGVGICLIGNFDDAPPTPRQRVAAAQLVDQLVAEHGISRNNILRHCDLKTTECPGRLFPFEDIAGQDASPENGPPEEQLPPIRSVRLNSLFPPMPR